MTTRRPARRLAVAVAAIVLLGSGCTSDGRGAVPAPGDPQIALDNPDLRQAKATAGIADCAPGTATSDLPDITLDCLGGGPSVDLWTFLGRTVRDLFYPGCEPCRTEMPVLGQFADRFGDQVPVLGVDYLDTFPGTAIEDAGERGATYPQLADPGGELGGQQAFARSSRGLPFTVFVDAQGKVAGEHSGGVTSLEQLTGLVDRYLGTDLSSP